jgi:hypothetical protein
VRGVSDTAPDCLQRADEASTNDIREHYRMIAAYYTEPAVAEEANATRHRPDDKPRESGGAA